MFDLPVVPFEDILTSYPPDEYKFFVAMVYSKMNRLRTRLYKQAKNMGYCPASYISKDSFVWKNCDIGEHCFIFENNVIQPFVKIGNNVILWSGNHIGHHSKIGNNCFVSSHVVVSGVCEIKENCFLGVNSTLADTVTIEKDCLIGAGSVVLKNTECEQIYMGNPAKACKVNTLSYFNIKD